MDGAIAIVCSSVTVNMARFGNFVIIIIMVNLNEMLCTKHIIVFSFGNSFPIALSDENVGKQFPREKTMIEY